MEQKLDPFNPDYKKIEDLPADEQKKFKPASDGFVQISAIEDEAITPDEVGKAKNMFEKTERYMKDFNGLISGLEMAELSADGGVSIKTKGRDEISYKNPRELFYLGASAGENKNEKDIEKIKEQLGFIAPRFFDWRLKFSGFSSAESISALNADLNLAHILATDEFNPGRISDFLEIDDLDKTADIRSYDKELEKVSEPNVSEKLRINHLYNKLIRWSSNNEDEMEYLTDELCEKDPLFVEKFLDYTVRMCLTSGHGWSFGLFKILTKKPELYQKLNEDHKNFSLPYLLERDYYGRIINSSKDLDGKNKLIEELREIMKILNIDLASIRTQLQESESPRKYMPQFEK